MTATRTKYDGICGLVMSSSCLYHVAEEILFIICPSNYIWIPIISATKFDFHKPYVTLRKGPLMHNTVASVIFKI